MASYQKTVTTPISKNEDVIFHDGANRRKNPLVLLLCAFVGFLILILLRIIFGDEGLATVSDSLEIRGPSQSIKSGSNRSYVHAQGQVSQQIKEGASRSGDDRRSIIVKILRDLEASIVGTVYLPDEDNNESFCSAHVWSERSVAADLAPWAVIEVQNEADVQKVVPILAALKRQYNFPFRIRSGGHNKVQVASCYSNPAVLLALVCIAVHSVFSLLHYLLNFFTSLQLRLAILRFQKGL